MTQIETPAENVAVPLNRIARIRQRLLLGNDASVPAVPAAGRNKNSGGKRKMSQLRPQQQKMLEFIEQFIEENNLPPTVREIQVALKISSTSVVDYNLKALESKGFIERTGGKSRAINLKHQPKGSRAVLVPLEGTIAAGRPIEKGNDPDPSELVEVPAFMLGKRASDVFALRVKGDSMVDALIGNGDIVLIKPQETAEVGETVAAWLESERETTLKKWYPDPANNMVRLQPANTTMKPIYTELSNVRIMGKLVGVIRTDF